MTAYPTSAPASRGAAEVGCKGPGQKRSQRDNYNVGLFNKIAANFDCEDIHGSISDFRWPARARLRSSLYVLSPAQLENITQYHADKLFYLIVLS